MLPKGWQRYKPKDSRIMQDKTTGIVRLFLPLFAKKVLLPSGAGIENFSTATVIG
jgi:hypothetical protein